jgi:hypothetical protein
MAITLDLAVRLRVIRARKAVDDPGVREHPGQIMETASW